MDQKDWDKYHEKADRDFVEQQYADHNRLHHGIGARPGGSLPALAGVATVGFAAVVGAIAGIVFVQNVVGAIAGAVIFGLIAFVLRLAFANGSFARPAIIKYAAIGAVLGFVLNVGAALFLRMSIDTGPGVVIGLICGLGYCALVGRHNA